MLRTSSSVCNSPTVEDRFDNDDLPVKPELRTGAEGKRAVFMDGARITEWTTSNPLTAPIVPWLEKLLNDARVAECTCTDKPLGPVHGHQPRCPMGRAMLVDEVPTTKHGTIPPKGRQ